MIVVRGLPPDLILCEEASVSVQKPLWQKIASLETFVFRFLHDLSQEILLVVRQKYVHLAFSGTRICSN